MNDHIEIREPSREKVKSCISVFNIWGLQRDHLRPRELCSPVLLVLLLTTDIAPLYEAAALCT